MAQVPADRDRDHLGWEPEPGKRRPVDLGTGGSRSTHPPSFLRQDRLAAGARRTQLTPYAEAARRLAISERTIERLVRSGALPTADIGGCSKIRATELVGYIERRPFGPLGCGADSSGAAGSP
jgi:excisionase family DNA binding protein